MPLPSKEELIQKIHRSLLLRADLKEKLLMIIDQLTDDDRKALSRILDQGEDREHEMLTRLIEHDPEFPAKLKRFMQQQLRTVYKAKEKEETKKEEKKGEELLKELEDI